MAETRGKTKANKEKKGGAQERLHSHFHFKALPDGRFDSKLFVTAANLNVVITKALPFQNIVMGRSAQQVTSLSAFSSAASFEPKVVCCDTIFRFQ